MVVDVVALAYWPQFGIYDAELNDFDIKNCNSTVNTWEIGKVNEHIANIINAINKPINDFYLIVSFEYFNEIIKKFVETAKAYDIKRFHIMNHYQMDAVLAVKYLDENLDSMWLFSCRVNEIRCAIWKKHDNHQVKMLHLLSEDRTTGLSTLEDLRKFKNKVCLNSASPIIVILQREIQFMENECKQVFSDYPKMYFQHYNSFIIDLLNIIKRQKNNVIPYKIQPMLGRSIFVMYNEIFVIIESDCNLPFQNEYKIHVKPDNMRLKIYENTTLTKTITLNELGEISLTLQIDINGIFKINLERKGDNIYPYTFGVASEKTVFEIPARLETYEKGLNCVGIDLGTSECYAFVIRRNGPDGVVLDSVTNQRNLPSYVAVDERGQPCGQIVIKRMEQKDAFTAFDIKKLMGKELNEIDIDPLWPYEIIYYYEQIHLKFGEAPGFWMKSTVDICSRFLKHIKEKVDEYQGTELNEAVITLPSSFTEKQKDATTDAANDAGWENVTFLKEPAAALLAYAFELDIPNQSIVLLFDCGGGTTDICIAKICNNKIEILYDSGDPCLGGKDFDKLLINYYNNAMQKYGLNVLETNKKYRLMIKCQEIKHTLSVNLHDSLYVDEFKFDENDAIMITRKEFEDMAADLILRAKHLIFENLEKAKLHCDDINIVLQVGGGCRMPMIKKMLAEVFPNAQQKCSIHPEELVAKGAALYAYSLNTEKKNKNVQQYSVEKFIPRPKRDRANTE